MHPLIRNLVVVICLIHVSVAFAGFTEIESKIKSELLNESDEVSEKDSKPEFDLEVGDSGNEIAPGYNSVGSIRGKWKKDNIELTSNLKLYDGKDVSSGNINLNITDDISSFNWAVGSVFDEDSGSNYLKLSHSRLWGEREKGIYDYYSHLSLYIDDFDTRRASYSMGWRNENIENIFSCKVLRSYLELGPDVGENTIECGLGYERKLWFESGILKNIGIKGTYFNCSKGDETYEDGYEQKQIGGYGRFDGTLVATLGVEREEYSLLTKIEGGYRHSNYLLNSDDGFVCDIEGKLASKFGIFTLGTKVDGVKRDINASYLLPVSGAGLKIYANDTKLKEFEDSDRKIGVEISFLTSKIKGFFDKNFWKTTSLQYLKNYHGYTSIYQAKHMDGFETNDLADNPIVVLSKKIEWSGIEDQNQQKIIKLHNDAISPQVSFRMDGTKLIIDPVPMIINSEKIKPGKDKDAVSISAGNIEIDLAKTSGKYIWCVANENDFNPNSGSTFTLVKVRISNDKNMITVTDVEARCYLKNEIVETIMRSDSGWNDPYLDDVKNLHLDQGCDSGISQSDGITRHGSMKINFNQVAGGRRYKISAKNLFSGEEFFDWADESDFISNTLVSKTIDFNKGGHWAIKVTPFNEFGHGNGSETIVVCYAKDFYFLNKEPLVDYKNLKATRLYGLDNGWKYSTDVYVYMPIKSNILLPEFENLDSDNVIVDPSGVDPDNFAEGYRFYDEEVFYRDGCIVLRMKVHFTSRVETDLEDFFSWDTTLKGVNTSVGFIRRISDEAGNELPNEFPKKFRIPNPMYVYWYKGIDDLFK